MNDDFIKIITRAQNTELFGEQLGSQALDYRIGNKKPLIEHLRKNTSTAVSERNRKHIQPYLFSKDSTILSALSVIYGEDWTPIAGQKLLGLFNSKLSDVRSLEARHYGALAEEHFDGITLQNFYFSQCDLSWIAFQENDFREFRMENCYMLEGCFSNTVFCRGSITESIFSKLWHIRGVKFDQVDFHKSVFIDTTFRDVVFQSCETKSCTFINCSFANSEPPPEGNFLSF